MMKIITKNEQGEPVEVNALTFDEEYPFATSPFDEEPRLPEMPRDHTVMHLRVVTWQRRSRTVEEAMRHEVKNGSSG